MSETGQTVSDAIAAPRPDFAGRVRNAVVWRMGSQIAAQMITWTSTLIVVRLLDPRDYGLFAMTQVVIVALNFLNGYSFATSLIQAREIDDRKVGQVFGLLIIANTVLAISQFLMAPIAADYYGQPLVKDMLQIQAFIFFTTPFIALPSALLARKIEFRSQALVNLICAAAGGATALILAWQGYGVWALVYAPIVLFAVRAIGLTIAAKLLVWPVFDFRGAWDLISFGGALTLCQLFWIIQSQSDILIAGRTFSAHDLGIYSEAMFLTMIFAGRFLPPLNEVAFPAYSELHNSGQPIGPAFLKTVRAVMLLAAPVYVGFSLTAEPLVATVFGEKWLEMAPIAAGISIAMPALALHIVCSPTTNALGRPSIYVMTSIAGAILFPAAFFMGVAYGPQGLVYSWWVAAPLLLAFSLSLTLPAIGLRARELAIALFPVAAACAAMGAAVFILRDQLPAMLPALELVILVAAGAISYGAALWFGWPDYLKEAWALIVKRDPEVLVADETELRAQPHPAE
ncbi:lipopolysaccharide biosynthesis protein [Altererythrobacter sp. ZODW24]|uniref:lipopolysaccharide biosynthesis protein n=1 Tax=Altererythrobacter sp. ZODW24 TaxID=2185142 RepID=UPI000DF7AFF5|nr:lipopolysaccharide biosynthesis protein [Altererythrobacter sp. ZODW24]